jgi:hypothetical protein
VSGEIASVVTQPVSSAAAAAVLAAQGVSNPANLPKLSLPTYQAEDPFNAYLLSLSDPAAIAEAAASRLAATGAGGNGTTNAALRALAGTGTGANALAAAVAQALGLTGQANGEGSITGAATALSSTVLATTGGDALTALAGTQALEAANAATDTTTAAAGSTYATGAAADAEQSDAAARAQADAQAAALAAQNATATPAAVAAVAAVLAEATGVTRADSDRATDSTAKFMGAGALAQVGDAGLGQAGLAAQDAIPALNGIGAARPMAANTYSNPQERAFGQTTARPTAVPFLNPLEGSRVDITG